MPNLFDNVGQTTAAAHSGTGSYTLTGTGAAAIPGFDSFSGAAIPNGTQVSYLAKMTTDWEVGIGTYSTGGTLSRDRIFRSSNGGLAVNWGAGSKSVYITMSAALADGLFPTAKGILVGIEIAPNAAPYFARRIIARTAGKQILINGGANFDGSTGDFEIGLDTAINVRDYLEAFGRSTTGKSAPFTVAASECGAALAITAGANGDDVTMPLSATVGRGGLVILENGTANTFDVVRAGSDTIAYSRTAITLPPGAVVVLCADGTAAWRVISFFPGYGTAGQYLQAAAAGLPVWGAVTLPVAASQAEMEAAASTTAFVTPANIKHAPVAVKVSGYLTTSGGTPTLGSPDVGISGVSDDGVGRFTFTFDTSFSSTGYAAVLSIGNDVNSNANILSRAVGSLSIACGIPAVSSNHDPAYVAVHITGDI